MATSFPSAAIRGNTRLVSKLAKDAEQTLASDNMNWTKRERKATKHRCYLHIRLVLNQSTPMGGQNRVGREVELIRRTLTASYPLLDPVDPNM